MSYNDAFQVHVLGKMGLARGFLIFPYLQNGHLLLIAKSQNKYGRPVLKHE